MFKKQSIYEFIESKYLFYLVFLVNVLLIFFTKFYPSMDGPAHLYNSNILNQIIGGNAVLRDFYSVNTLPIPNWTSHILLSIFHYILPAYLSEKVLIVLYISGMAFSFRFLIKVLNPENISLSILIFPFIYSFLFHLGFYNYCISFILFFATLGFWIQNQAYENLVKYVILFLLLTITYFSNILMFGLLGLTIGLYTIFFVYNVHLINKDFFLLLRNLSKKLLFLLLVSLPSLVFVLIFYNNVTFFPSDQSVSIALLIKWINDARPFIVYDYISEEIITEQFFHVLLLLILVSFILKKRTGESGRLDSVKKSNVLVISLILLLLLYFITPTGSSAGMMSDRYALAFYLILLTWAVSRAIPGKFNILIVFLILILHFGLLFNHLNGTIRNLDKHAISIYKTADYVKENSIVLPINLSDNWVELHFSNYLGVEKPIVILENYEAEVGWFPIKWNIEAMPNILLGDKNSVSGLHWITNNNSKNIIQINNILLFGNTSKIEEPKWTELLEVINSQFKIKFKSNDSYVVLYERTQE